MPPKEKSKEEPEFTAGDFFTSFKDFIFVAVPTTLQNELNLMTATLINAYFIGTL